MLPGSNTTRLALISTPSAAVIASDRRRDRRDASAAGVGRVRALFAAEVFVLLFLLVVVLLVKGDGGPACDGAVCVVVGRSRSADRVSAAEKVLEKDRLIWIC